MKTNNKTGRNFVVLACIYLFVKGILNLIIGGGFNLSDIVFAIIASVAAYSGLECLNYAIAAILAIGVVTNLPHNLTHLPGSIIYLLEAAVDVGVILLLILQKDVKEHFTNKWSEISELFKK